MVVIKWLLPDPVAREEKAVARLVPDGDGKHAIESLQAIRSPFLVGMKDNFRVALRAKNVTLGFQLRTQVAEIVQLAVKDNAARHVFVPNRLLPAG